MITVAYVLHCNYSVLIIVCIGKQYCYHVYQLPYLTWRMSLLTSLRQLLKVQYMDINLGLTFSHLHGRVHKRGNNMPTHSNAHIKHAKICDICTLYVSPFVTHRTNIPTAMMLHPQSKYTNRLCLIPCYVINFTGWNITWLMIHVLYNLEETDISDYQCKKSKKIWSWWT